jgi:hypothetical protein
MFAATGKKYGITPFPVSSSKRNRMKHSLIIQMPEPCTESWADMEPTANGRTCASCERELTDFSRFSNAQLVEFASQHSGRLCGRFAPHQLNRELVAHPVAASFSGLSLPALALMAATLTAQPANSQEIIPAQTQSSTVKTDDVSAKREPVTFSGMVTDVKTGEAIVFCRVDLLLKGTVLQTFTTDLDGRFSMPVPPEMTFDSLRFSNTHELYETKTIAVTPRSAGSFLDVHLRYMEEQLLEGDVIVVSKKSSRRHERKLEKENRKNK